MNLRYTPILLLALTACGTAVFSPDEEALLRNPLYAEQYSEALVDALVNLEIYENPLLEDEAKKKIADETKEEWLKVAKKARADQRDGSIGQFIPMEQFAEGEAIYVHDLVHMSPQFFMTPGPEVRLYLSKVIDPRDAEFPDPTALDLGTIKSAYGAQSYAVPTVDNPKEYRTLVLWDAALGMLVSFAQLNPLY